MEKHGTKADIIALIVGLIFVVMTIYGLALMARDLENQSKQYKIDAHKNGIISGKNGIDPSINPYEGTSYSRYWKAGYIEGFNTYQTPIKNEN